MTGLQNPALKISRTIVYDVIIVGGGLAGLSAALLLGRCQRRVLLIDSNEPRNGVSLALHGYLTRDGVTPWLLRRQGQDNVRKYPTVTLRDGQVRGARRQKGGFEVSWGRRQRTRSRLLLLATGRIDPLPVRPGFREFFGRGIHHCPYCDGYEYRGKPLAVYGGNEYSYQLAEELLTWSNRVTICTDGPAKWKGKHAKAFSVIKDDVAGLGGRRTLREIRFTTGRPPLRCAALFFATDCQQHSVLPEMLGCRIDQENSVVCTGFQAAGVKDLFVAGNVRGGAHLAITAAAEGAEAAIAMNDRLQELRVRGRQNR